MYAVRPHRRVHQIFRDPVSNPSVRHLTTMTRCWHLCLHSLLGLMGLVIFPGDAKQELSPECTTESSEGDNVLRLRVPLTY